MKRAQSALEAAIIIGIMTFFLIVFLLVISDKVAIATDDRTKEIAEDLADVIEAELMLAANAQNGYIRTMSLPFSLDGKPYHMFFYNRSNTEANFTQFTVNVPITGGNYTVLRVMPDYIVGNLRVGDNLVRKAFGFVNITMPIQS